MAVLDIVAIGILAVTVIVCTLKGFAKILLQTFSWFFAWLCTKLFGAKLIGYFFSEVLALDPKWDWLTPLCVVLLFWCKKGQKNFRPFEIISFSEKN